RILRRTPRCVNSLARRDDRLVFACASERSAPAAAQRRNGSSAAPLRRCGRIIVLTACDVLLAHHKMASILLFGLLAAGANVLGGLVLVKSGAHPYGERFLKYLV